MIKSVVIVVALLFLGSLHAMKGRTRPCPVRQQREVKNLLPQQIIPDTYFVCLYPSKQWFNGEQRLRGSLGLFHYSMFDIKKRDVGYGDYVLVEVRQQIPDLAIVAAHKNGSVVINAENCVLLKSSCSVIEFYSRIDGSMLNPNHRNSGEK